MNILMEKETFYPDSRQAWREWLHENHHSKPSIWLVCYKKHTNIPTISWSEAVDEALCFGWIDSTRVSVDNDAFIQFFCPRKPRSGWSKINKEKIARLTEEGLMTSAGLKSIEIAKQNGSWDMLDEIEALIIPQDLTEAFEEYPSSLSYFLGLSKSVRKSLLHWLVLAKRPETRQKRIREVASLASQKQLPKQFR